MRVAMAPDWGAQLGRDAFGRGLETAPTYRAQRGRGSGHLRLARGRARFHRDARAGARQISGPYNDPRDSRRREREAEVRMQNAER